jgi:gamma-glutamyltranspeptidase/glutathione hydrolase
LALERFGSMGLDSVLDRAIAYARQGFPVSQRIARGWASVIERLNPYADSRRVWLPQGRAPKPAEIFRNRELAQTLETVAEHGYDAFYKGDIARQIVDCVQAAGGTLQAEDLATYEAEWVEPIRLDYGNGVAFHEIPPNGQGLTALLALNIVQGFDVGALGYGTADYYHTLIEAMKLAFADASEFIADPRQAKVPVEAMLSKRYAAERRGLIDGESVLLAGAGRPQQHEDTVYLTVADEDGNMVSWIQSLYMDFGSGLTAGNTGVLLQNRGANFSLQPGHPNEAAPGKRPYHTIIPGFITRDNQAWCSYGVMGGFMQPQGHLQVGINLVDFGMDPQTALDAPRFRWLKEKEVALEATIGDFVGIELARRGHQLAARDAGVHYGGGQVIIRDLESGVLVGGSEPRNDGMAVGW